MGTADLAATVLRALIQDTRYQVVGVISQPDRPQGRSLQVQPTPVKQVALAHLLPIFQPEKARDPVCLARVQSWQPDVVVVAAYGQLLPPDLLHSPTHGCVNVHTSLLPRWRGAAPIQWAIASGDSETGVTLMILEEGLDTGPIVTQSKTPIDDSDTGQSLHDRLAQLGADLLTKSLLDYIDGRLSPRPQPNAGITHARKLTREDGRLDWSLPAAELARQIRAFNPWPGSFTFAVIDNHLMRVKIHRATLHPTSPGSSPPALPGTFLPADPGMIRVQCGQDCLLIEALQPEGSRRMSPSEFLAGHPINAFTNFTHSK
jgi:methionyl-tRNA formyltransferase